MKPRLAKVVGPATVGSGGMKLERQPPFEQFGKLRTTYASEWPARRPLKIFALDPLTGTAGNRVTIDVPNEPLGPGPVGGRIKVIDYDGTLNVFYAPVDFDEPPILMRNGLDPSESDPRFHQQMVYAVAMRVLENFERALGRTLRFAKGRELRILPHAFGGANAFFDPATTIPNVKARGDISIDLAFDVPEPPDN